VHEGAMRQIGLAVVLASSTLLKLGMVRYTDLSKATKNEHGSRGST
jgi:hypothetical protein